MLFSIPVLLLMGNSGCERLEKMSADELVEVGKRLSRERKFDDAIEIYNKALVKDSTHSEAYFHKALAKDNMGLTEEAIKDFTSAINHGPKPVYYNHRGIGKAILGDFEGAIKDYTEAIKLDARFSDAYINRGYAWNELDNREEACKDFHHARNLRHFQAPEIIMKRCR